jgi:hypothetical protein
MWGYSTCEVPGSSLSVVGLSPAITCRGGARNVRHKADVCDRQLDCCQGPDCERASALVLVGGTSNRGSELLCPGHGHSMSYIRPGAAAQAGAD